MRTLPQQCAAFLGVIFILSCQFVSAQANSALAEQWATQDTHEHPLGTQPSSLDIPTNYLSLPSIIQLPADTRFFIWSELNTGKLHIVENMLDDRYRIVRTIPVSIGKKGAGKEREGDLRTPIGIYRITRYIPGKELVDFYGPGAYPINYPNVWDKLHSRTGYGIWLHGLPSNVDQRPKLDSEGCVVLDNKSLKAIDKYISLGTTLVILGEELRTIDASTDELSSRAPLSEGVLQALENWRIDWESLNTKKYLEHYHSEFYALRKDKDGAKWTKEKTALNKRKRFIEVEISKLTAVQYPGEENLVRMRFYQKYHSSNYDWSGWKEMFWRKDSEGQWKIAHEGNG